MVKPPEWWVLMFYFGVEDSLSALLRSISRSVGFKVTRADQVSGTRNIAPGETTLGWFRDRVLEKARKRGSRPRAICAVDLPDRDPYGITEIIAWCHSQGIPLHITERKVFQRGLFSSRLPQKTRRRNK